MAGRAALASCVAMKALLVDDHALLRESLALLVSLSLPGMTLLQAGSLAEARVQIAAHEGLRLVLVDLALPDADGLHSLVTLRELAPDASHVVISADDRPETVLAAIEAGAAGFIPKTTEASVMLAALRSILAGEIYLPPTLAGRRPKSQGIEELGLSPRQGEVLRLLIEGRSNKAICRVLDLSESTVKTHLEAIFRKLAVNSRTQAVVAAARLGLRLPPVEATAS